MKTPITRKTPMGALLCMIYLESGLPLPAFIAEVGYNDIPKGIRTFYSWMNTGTGNMLFIERLQRSRFALDPEVMFDALHLTENQILQENELEREKLAREQAAEFIPTLYAVPELDPSGRTTLFATTRHFDDYTVELPVSIPSWAPDKQYAVIALTIRENYQRTNGRMDPLGAIVSYLYRRHWNEAPLAFTTEGDLLGIAPDRSFQHTELCIRNKPMQRKLFAHFLCSRDDVPLH